MLREGGGAETIEVEAGERFLLNLVAGAEEAAIREKRSLAGWRAGRPATDSQLIFLVRVLSLRY